MRLIRVAAVAAAVVASLSACTTPAHRTAAPVSPAPAVQGLRGTPIERFTCDHPLGEQSGLPLASLPISRVTGDPIELLVCTSGDLAPTRLTPADGPRYSRLVEAVSLRDTRGRRVQLCYSSLEFYPLVILRTVDGVWFVHEPIDGANCSRLRPRVMSALVDALRQTR